MNRYRLTILIDLYEEDIASYEELSESIHVALDEYGDIKAIKHEDEDCIKQNDKQDSRLRELVEADRDGRCVVLESRRMPLIWGDEERSTLLCPICGEDLMGGYPDSRGRGIGVSMVQCRFCGQPINDYIAVPRAEAEAALAEKE